MSSQTTSGAGRLRVAFEHYQEPGWTGGMVYMQNLLGSIASLDDGERPFTFMIDRAGETANNLPVDKRLGVPPDQRNLATRAIGRLVRRLGGAVPRPPLGPVLEAEQVDALFTDRIYPPSMAFPMLSWIPDFQYVHLPDMAGPEQVRFCTDLHRKLIAQSRSLLVSSEDVLKDLKNFAPDAAGRTHVVRFVALVPANVYDADPDFVCPKYSLPKRYFFMPNQFWAHKNHRLVVRALRILRDRSVDVTVVCTGNPTDHRNPGFFASLLTEIATAGVYDKFRLLGMVPRSDVYQLARQSVAVVQPSLFEGWSTSIEEAKSLGKRVVASDLDVNREQVPGADFFARSDAEQLADCLESVTESAGPGPDPQQEAAARAAYPGRVKDFARTFLAVVRAAQ